jgi:hypothetical protein
MTDTIERNATKFTRTVSGFAELGAIFDIDPEANPLDEHTLAPARVDDAAQADGAASLDACLDVVDQWAGEPDPAARLAGLKALGTALAARRERDREERAAALRELADHDERLKTIEVCERDREEVRATRVGFEAALAKPFGDPDWLYDEALRDDYSRALAEAVAVEAALTDRIAGLRREAERLAAKPVLARLLAERCRWEEGARAKENAAEANRQRSLALASAVQLRDADSLQEARRVLGPVISKFPDDPESRSIMDSIILRERTVKDTAAAATLAEARRLRRNDPDGAVALIALIDTATLSADRMHEIAGVAADIARHRELVNPRFLRGHAPNSLAIVAEQCGEWQVAIAVGQDPALKAGNIVAPQLATAARPLRRRR